jgi:ectoine hydroxylase-related dioxygenase (phytanoyl-CoA dioxygenase family)
MPPNDRPAPELALPDLTLPDLTSRYSLPASCVTQYRETGHTVVRGLASADEVAAYAPTIVRLAKERAWDRRPLAERDTYGKAFLQAMNLWQHDAAVAAFVLSERFAAVAAELMGVEGVRLYHDQALCKEPGGGHTPWHQDQVYWPLDTDRTITMWMPLVDVRADMGMVFASGTHRDGCLSTHAIGDPSQEFFDALVRERGLELVSHAPFAAGDATFHSGWTLHSAPANPTGQLRSVMTVIYFADGTRVGAIDNGMRRMDQQAWLGGLAEGEPAAGPLNPVVFSTRR